MEKNQLLIFKNDYNILSKKYTKLEEILKEQQRVSKKTIDNKNKEMHENQDSSSKNIKALEEKLSQSQDKNKEQKFKIQELENNLQVSKN